MLLGYWVQQPVQQKGKKSFEYWGTDIHTCGPNTWTDCGRRIMNLSLRLCLKKTKNKNKTAKMFGIGTVSKAYTMYCRNTKSGKTISM
jgi:hypothetical protein